MSRVVLTADQTLMSDYNRNIFLGFTACSPVLIPLWIFQSLFCPPISHKNGIALAAPYGLRKIEASLIEHGFDEDEVRVAHPAHLDKVVDKDTRVIGISTNDPLGLGPASTTFSDLVGRETYSSVSFIRLLKDPEIRKYDPKIIVGGPGAWQLDDARIMAKLGIDSILIGEGELRAPEIFERAVRGEEIPSVVEGGPAPVDKIPTIRAPSLNGLVEIARGCGRGCRFCNPTMRQFRSVPIEQILREVRVNIEGGYGVLLHAEDVLRYGAKGPIPDERKVTTLFKEVARYTLRVGISHFALSSVLSRPELIGEISEVLEVGKSGRIWLSGQTGIETGSTRLIERHLRGKVKPFGPDEWREVVVEAFGLLQDNRWVPCATLIMGMPGEEREDVLITLELIEELKTFKSLIVPLFFVPVGRLERERFFRRKDMLPEHWMLLSACIRHDLGWVRELAAEHLEMTGIRGVKRWAIDRIIAYAARKLGPYLELMDEGIPPYRDPDHTSGFNRRVYRMITHTIHGLYQ
ncbi:MAG TPA: B12-binding domain-containing radical SAM protein [Candidatus Syntrophoarchaeum butanivorans]|uniref:B12-binding domain-containing radical SAM protein n=1 Tax=Candidatus Syntropharchaeum butanivorans TaxID=1839936 RepID=A0A7C1B3X0_9EURY|nr:B12-binding domain-containing radical SAM protein [Candidatus Syntrophoarchaeum butanivorans]